jgi:excisionase family DNA binding protein
MNSTSRLLTPDQVAEILQVHVLTVYSYIKKGKFDAVRLGRSYRIAPDDLDNFIKSNKSKNNSIPGSHSIGDR